MVEFLEQPILQVRPDGQSGYRIAQRVRRRVEASGSERNIGSAQCFYLKKLTYQKQIALHLLGSKPKFCVSLFVSIRQSRQHSNKIASIFSSFIG